MIILFNQQVVAEANICHKLARSSDWLGLLKICRDSATVDKNPIAAYILGYMYWNGVYVSKENSKAIKWYSLASDNGHAQAKMNLGVIFLKSNYADKSSGELLISQAAKLGHKPAIELLKRLKIHEMNNPISTAVGMENYLHIINDY